MFSVIIPVHNKLPHLERSINSVLNQSFKDFELLLIDDASTDGSTEKLLEFNDPRIKRFRREEPGPGGYAARNLGIKEAKYEWIAFLDADDEWNLTYLNNINKAIELHEGVEVVSSKWQNKWNGEVVANRNWTKWIKFKNIKENNYCKFSLIDFLHINTIIWTSAVVIRKKLLLEIGLFPAGLCRRGGDLDTWIRCLQKSKTNVFINKTLATYYTDTVNQVTNKKINPSTVFCPGKTLNKLRLNTNDGKLLNAINDFSQRHIFNILLREPTIEKKRREQLLSFIDSRRLRIKLTLKLFVLNVLRR